MARLYLLILAGICCASPALALVLPDCAGRVEIARARAVRVEKNGVIVLNDGRAALLEGIRLPGLDRPALADAALAALRELALDGPLTLTAIRPKEDRYDRVRVQAFAPGRSSQGAQGTWLQVELLRRGLAQVALSPDRGECAPDLYDAEKEARLARRGLWDGSGVRENSRVGAADSGSFLVVVGQVVNVASHDGRTFVDFNDDFHQGFSATIAPEDRKSFRDLDPPLEGLVGRRIRLRGMVEDYKGRPEIALSSPQQIELLN